MGALQPIHLVIILAIVLLLFGSRIPAIMRGLGQGTGEFKKGLEESKIVPPEDAKATEKEEAKASEKT